MSQTIHPNIYCGEKNVQNFEKKSSYLTKKCATKYFL